MSQSEDKKLSVPVIGISRFRFGTDGEGITTLVAFQGCPLHCRYCLNKECWQPESNFSRYTPEELYEKVKKDDLFFKATGGGITFGGGEPALRADFIVRFRELCGSDWKLRIETSLNVKREYIEKLVPVIDEWIIDIKVYNGKTYRHYCRASQRRFSSNLEYLLSKSGYNVSKENVILKVPVIPKYVSIKEADETIGIYKTWYGCRVKKIFYKDNEELEYHKEKVKERDGKRICELLKEIKRDIALKYGLELPERDCAHKGNCPGTCPLCESEVENLIRQLKEKGIDEIKISDKIKNMFYGKERNKIVKDNNDEGKEPKEEIAPIADTEPLGGQIVHCGEQEEPFEGEEIPRPDKEEPLQGEHIPFPQIPQKSEFYQYKKIFFKECAIAGISFHIKPDDEIWNELEEGTQLALIRQKENKHDRNAVAVALADDYNGNPENFNFDFILGYIPRSENTELASLLDAGYEKKFSAEITTIKRYGNVNNRIRITIYIESNEPQLVRPNYYRAQTLTPFHMRNMIRELKEYGVAYFRFGGYPPFDLMFPEVGEKIIMIYPVEDNIVLYLTRIMAEGEDCRRYRERWGDQYCDDQMGYVVSVISGPIITSVNELKILQELNLFNLNGINYLSKDATNDFRRFFDKVLFKIGNKGNIDMDPSMDDKELRKEIEEDDRRDN